MRPPVRNPTGTKSLHGTRTRYQHGCRCEECYAASKKYHREFKARTPDPEYVRKTRAEFFQENNERLKKLKLELGCKICGYKTHPDALAFDHVRGQKKFSISTRKGGRWENIALELEKCDVLCSNCHAIKSARGARERMKKYPWPYSIKKVEIT